MHKQVTPLKGSSSLSLDQEMRELLASITSHPYLN